MGVAQIAGCATSYDVPVAEFEQPPTEKIMVHRVADGETLYAIAWRYNMDARQLAARNRLNEPYRLRIGQRLALDMQGRDWTTEVVSKQVAAREPRNRSANAKASSATAQAATVSKPRAAHSGAQPSRQQALGRLSKWAWPTDGKLLSRSRDREAKRQGFRGLDIAGEKGQPILAANNGVVVYAGNGLKTLGNLLIVKHENEYLSAYAHNSRLLVSQGEKVKIGQKIAELGSSGTHRNYLHFEIRHRGKPIDPLQVLPNRRALALK